MTSIPCNQVFGALAFSSSVVLKPTAATHWGYSVAGICVYVFILLPYLGLVYFILYHICSEDGPYCSFESMTYNSAGVGIGSIAGAGSDGGAGTGAGAGTSTGTGVNNSGAGAPSESAPTDMVLNGSSQVTTAKSNANATTVFALTTLSTTADTREPKANECIVCKVHANTRCKACETFWYCSQECQVKVTIQLS